MCSEAALTVLLAASVTPTMTAALPAIKEAMPKGLVKKGRIPRLQTT